MFNASDAVWQPGIFKRWQFDQWHRQSEHSQQAIVRYVGSEDRNTRDTRDTLEGSFWLTVYAHQISGAREVEGIQERVRRFEKLGELERLEHFADYAVEV